MRPWLVLLVILVVLYLLSRLRLGIMGQVMDSSFRAWVKAGPIRIQVYPSNRKQTGPEVHKKRGCREGRGRKDQAESGEKSGAASLLSETLGEMPPAQLPALARCFLPVIGRAAGRLTDQIRVGPVHLDIHAGDEDPGDTALLYGGINGALGILFPILEQNFDCKDCHIRTEAAFQSERTMIAGDFDISMTLGQLLLFGLWLLRTLPAAAKAWREIRDGETTSERKEGEHHGK
ncbi:DUF2953 domain-containing protein [Pseudoflavonifractor sp. MSJ-37]|uniref:DUF2953 domain-containing protein n=1 Tax=Pseudoflavonifractor sp. MSJ-37 TaxID=2841531 RepID=UPI001C107EF8|nr:DUF2953 domain-containing protein [Pseudoflavonifractor sp. MSJ-37]MBU5434814.1 DUF2953 domain-containing protein [Pseudoflavonifractor sp. MSJ-37]